MPIDMNLENYLARLDRALGPISVGDRADIITEIKSHVLEAQSRHQDQSLDSILSSLGEPETVANRYLLERGLKPGKPSRSPIIKWLVIGTLGTMAIGTAAVLLLVFMFSPLISIDDERDRVILMGGMIDIDGKAGKIRFGSTEFQEDKAGRNISGTLPVNPKDNLQLHLEANNLKLEVDESEDGNLHWKCKYSGKDDHKDISREGNKLIAKFRDSAGTQCDLKVPVGLTLFVEATNGKVELNNLASAAIVEMTNGKVSVSPSPDRLYHYEMNVNQGKIDEFDSSDDPKAIPVTVKLVNGKIGKD